MAHGTKMSWVINLIEFSSHNPSPSSIDFFFHVSIFAVFAVFAIFCILFGANVNKSGAVLLPACIRRVNDSSLLCIHTYVPTLRIVTVTSSAFELIHW